MASSSKKKPRKLWFTTGEIARHCHVTPETVANWIKRGQLKSGSTPGGHYRISADEMVRFCREHGFDVPAQWEKASRPPTVLIIDDEPAIVDTLVETLKRPDRVVLGTHDIAKAGLLLIKNQPDLVILDLHLPGTDGVRIASMLRQESNLQGTHIIILSGFIDELVKDATKDLRVDYYIDKPPDLDDLSKKVTVILGQEEAE